MSFEIIFAPTAAKQIGKIRDRKLKERIAVGLEYLASDPAVGKPLKAEFKGFCSYRIGDYRIVYNFSREKNVVRIFKVEHRREVYR